jgi:hypothetical protein
MHEKNYSIKDDIAPGEEREAKRAGYTIPLTKPQATMLAQLSPANRKAWHEQQIKNRNAAKRARKARRAGRK